MSQNLLVDPNFQMADPSGSVYSGVTIPGWTETGTPTVIKYRPREKPDPAVYSELARRRISLNGLGRPCGQPRERELGLIAAGAASSYRTRWQRQEAMDRSQRTRNCQKVLQ